MLKNLIRRLRNGSFFYRIEKTYQSVWMGNGYGGFYVCPNGLTEKSIVYSVGVGEDISFDEAIIERFGCAVYAFDPTPKSIDWIKQSPRPPQYHFNPYGIGYKNGTARFFLPKNKQHVSGSLLSEMGHIATEQGIEVPIKTLKTAMQLNGHTHIDLLKMDIEGAEYAVIEDILAADLPIKQLTIEFHARMVRRGVARTNTAIAALRKADYHLFAISKTGEELSFLKIEKQV